MSEVIRSRVSIPRGLGFRVSGLGFRVYQVAPWFIDASLRKGILILIWITERRHAFCNPH